eukprot:TRINITY_DN3143_c0_g1_i1.p1 TRINITY_DN3143_c0_g1~~TRINITY_DN3143_c0_g1_i1.p1  ORF type:complete len:345 (-),score=12.41 TRINITY_DN3143_c0_g1_i1:189-1223(-)
MDEATLDSCMTVKDTTYETFDFYSSANFRLTARCWRPTKIEGAIVVSHGLAEHSGRYSRLAERVAPLGIAVFGVDHRSHGTSDKVENAPCYIHSIDDWTTDFGSYLRCVMQYLKLVNASSGDEDTASFTAFLKEKSYTDAPVSVMEYPPLVVMGHSMGGLILTHLTTYHSQYLYDVNNRPAVKGLILSAPALSPGSGIPKWLTVIGPYIVRCIPKKLKVLALDATAITRDKEEYKLLVSDPLRYMGMVAAGTANQLNEAMAKVAQRFDTIVQPLLLIYGTGDKLVGLEGLTKLYEQCKSTDKTFKVYPDGFHELLREEKELQDRVANDVVSWLQAHMFRAETPC